jgi:hypothetical protein
MPDHGMSMSISNKRVQLHASSAAKCPRGSRAHAADFVTLANSHLKRWSSGDAIHPSGLQNTPLYTSGTTDVFGCIAARDYAAAVRR